MSDAPSYWELCSAWKNVRLDLEVLTDIVRHQEARNRRGANVIAKRPRYAVEHDQQAAGRALYELERVAEHLRWIRDHSRQAVDAS